MRRDRAVRAAAGLLAVAVSAAGFAAATADELMVGGSIAAAFFVVAGLAGIAVAAGAVTSTLRRVARPVAAGAGVLLALSAIALVPFTAARSLCACTSVPQDQLPPAPSVAGVAPHDLLLAAAIAAPLLLLLAANVGRDRRGDAGGVPETSGA